MTTYKRHPLDKSKAVPRTAALDAADHRLALSLSAAWTRLVAETRTMNRASFTLAPPPAEPVTRTRYTPPTN